MPLAIAFGAVFALLVLMWVAIAKDRGPGPDDAALAYETAFDRLDFSMLYDLSGDELRGGLDRSEFVAAKRSAYGALADQGGPASRIEVESSVANDETAAVATRVAALGGDELRNQLLLERRGGRWVVVGYSLRPDPAGPDAPETRPPSP